MNLIALERANARNACFAAILLGVVVIAGCSSLETDLGGEFAGDIEQPPPPVEAVVVIPAAETKPLIEYTVQKGDTLWELAMAYDTTITDIKVANNFESDLIKAGQKILIPTTKVPSGATSSDAAAAMPETVTPGQGTQPISGAPSTPPSSLELGAPREVSPESRSSTGSYFRDGAQTDPPLTTPPLNEINVPSIVP